MQLLTEKAEMLNSFFHKCFNHSMPPLQFADLDELDPVNEYLHTEDILCTVEEVEQHLRTLDTSKANGPDGISAKMLKETATSIAPSVTKLFNLSLKSGCFPTLWKLSHVVPIPKSNDYTNPSNYRPISLLSILSKVLERHIHTVLTEHLSQHHLLSEMQWGFQTKKSTTLALLSVTHDWFQSLDSGAEVCAVFFDFKKAFDTVPHRNLISKLKSLHFNPALIRWICNYLTSRCQRVVVDGAMSQITPVISGVPQGSVLGPLLFLIYIDSVTKIHLSHGTKLTLYADDLLVYKHIYSYDDYTELQSDINLINNWTSENHLVFNTSKCKQMVISRKRNQYNFRTILLGNEALELVQRYKYLGVTITSNLSWSEHINTKCIKAKKLIGLLYRRFYGNADPIALFELYTALVRPHLEYACEVWNPHLQKERDQLERVQKYGLRMCSKQWNAGYTDILSLFKIPTLSDRREYLSLCTMFKITQDMMYFPTNVFVPKLPDNLRSSSNSFLFYQPFAKSNAFLYSFVPFSCSLWNKLPHPITHAPTLSLFKKLLLKYMSSFN